MEALWSSFGLIEGEGLGAESGRVRALEARSFGIDLRPRESVTVSLQVLGRWLRQISENTLEHGRLFCREVSAQRRECGKRLLYPDIGCLYDSALDYLSMAAD